MIFNTSEEKKRFLLKVCDPSNRFISELIFSESLAGFPTLSNLGPIGRLHLGKRKQREESEEEEEEENGEEEEVEEID